MTDVHVPPALQRDTMSRGSDDGEGFAGWRGSRDRARTPMQWDSSPAAGFTAAQVTPWLPAGDGAAVSVAGQRDDPGSVLGLCRELLSLRRAEFGGRVASYQPLPAPPGGWAYRAAGLTVLANFSDRPVACQDAGGPVLLCTAGTARRGARQISLAPWQGVIARTARA